MDRCRLQRAVCAVLALAQIGGLIIVGFAGNASAAPDEAVEKLRIIIETDAGGDPDDEQSLVRFLVYLNAFDVEGIIANRERARERENRNSIRDGLGIVRALVDAYGECDENLRLHDPRFPAAEHLRERTVAGYAGRDDGVQLIIRAVDAADLRPIWFCNWGTDHGSAESSLKRALDRVLHERGKEGYAKFKRRLRLSSADKFGDHTTTLDPPFPLWVNTLEPELEGRRWYHRFSALTAKAGGFDIERDVRSGHGGLGALYPLNTTHPQKEGDTMMFLYLVPTGMNDPSEPAWGSWAGRYGRNETHSGKPYYWANQQDDWNGSRHREQTVARWAAALQNDFRARMDWCVADQFAKANHPPRAALNGDVSRRIVQINAAPGQTVTFSAAESKDPDGDPLTVEWFHYQEAGTFRREVKLSHATGLETSFVAPEAATPQTIHLILAVRDNGDPNLFSYRRAVVTVLP